MSLYMFGVGGGGNIIRDKGKAFIYLSKGGRRGGEG